MHLPVLFNANPTIKAELLLRTSKPAYLKPRSFFFTISTGVVPWDLLLPSWNPCDPGSVVHVGFILKFVQISRTRAQKIRWVAHYPIVFMPKITLFGAEKIDDDEAFILRRKRRKLDDQE